VATLTTVPDTVDIVHYGGDTLSIGVTAPAGFVAGRVWSAQVRDTRDAASAVADFTIVPGATEDQVTLLLPADTCRTLAAALESSYVWDVQVAPAGGGDPTQTLAQGAFKVTLDVTRA